VRIGAKIKLVREAARNLSIPDGPKETFWEVQVLELREVSLYTE
jgi:hypothetical protein